MTIKITSAQILWVLYIIAWIIFVGICIEASSLLVNAVFALVKPETIPYLYKPADLTALLKFDLTHYFTLHAVMSIVAVLKAILFYAIIKIIHEKNLDMNKPFNKVVRVFILKIAYLATAIGLFSSNAANYMEWLGKQNVTLPGIQQVHLGGADVWLFMAVILFVIAQIFKKGIAIQSENDLTV